MLLRNALAMASPAASSPDELIRNPLEIRVRAFLRPKLVASRFACALTEAILVTTENDAMNRPLFREK